MTYCADYDPSVCPINCYMAEQTESHIRSFGDMTGVTASKLYGTPHCELTRKNYILKGDKTMTNQEFNTYVYEQKRQGRSESQIARSLGMSLAHFMGRINGVDVDKVDPPKKPTLKVEKPVEKKPEVKPVAGAKRPEKSKKDEKVAAPVDIPKVEEKKPEEDLSWME